MDALSKNQESKKPVTKQEIDWLVEKLSKIDSFDTRQVAENLTISQEVRQDRYRPKGVSKESLQNITAKIKTTAQPQFEKNKLSESEEQLINEKVESYLALNHPDYPKLV